MAKKRPVQMLKQPLPFRRRDFEGAIADLLVAAGRSLEDPALEETPRRVAEAWEHELLDGYHRSPERALATSFPVPKRSAGELVVVTGLAFHSMCPHHLLPYQGKAHLAYMPKRRMVGFGALSDLVDCHAHRLILQEDLAREIAASLARILVSPAAACVIEAEQGCLRMRGSCQREAVTHSEAYEGKLRADRQLRQEFWARIRARP